MIFYIKLLKKKGDGLMQEKRKKILFSAYSLDIGGIETALVSLINYLAKNYDITLVLERKQGIFLEQISKNVEIVEYTPSYLKIKPVAKVLNLYKRVKFMRKYKNQFDFACSYATYCQMGSFVARVASENNTLWVHNNYYHFFDRNDYKYKKFFNSINAHQFKNVVFVSEEAKNQYLEKYGTVNESVITCNNLIDYEKILRLADETPYIEVEKKESKNASMEKEKVALEKDDSITTFINVARHDEHQKRLTRLIECAKLLDEKNEKYRILLVGEGKDTESYKRLVNNLGLEKKVIFVGKTANPYPYFRISDCVILTSDYEGYPVTYIEAKILNKPIITTDVSDSQLDIKNKFGIVTEKNVKSIYKAMKKFIDNGYEIKEDFDPELLNRDIINKVKNIINERN